MNAVLAYFAPGRDAGVPADPGQVDSLYKRYRFQVMVAITIGQESRTLR